MVELIIVTKEFIKPSSPTPHHRKTYNISIVDQLSGTPYVPMLLFYPPPNTHDHSVGIPSHLLKHSLSRTLALYYPLAGRNNDFISIDCNDQGCYYISARVNLDLSDYLKNPDYSFFPKFMPEENIFKELKSGDPLVMIQETRFSCGGVAIGVSMSHMISDVTNIGCFLKCWSAIARNDDQKQAYFPDFSSLSLFPRADTNVKQFTSLMNLTISNVPIVTKRFVFDEAVMSSLKSEFKSASFSNPTRVEVVGAVLFRSIRTAIEAYSKHKSSVFAILSASFRRKAVPPLGESCIGNLIWMTPFLLDRNPSDLSGFVSSMRKAVSVIDENFVKPFIGEKGREGVTEAFQELGRSYHESSTSQQIPINSWCNLGLYECVDFGWGKPLWIPYVVAARPFPFLFVHLMDARHGKGIEAWVMLDERTMSSVENDQQLLSLAVVDPIG